MSNFATSLFHAPLLLVSWDYFVSLVMDLFCYVTKYVQFIYVVKLFFDESFI